MVYLRTVGDFLDIRVGGDWAFYDQLNGKDMERGLYEVKWPDGSVTQEIIEIERSRQTISDMGHDTQVPVKEAIFTYMLHGLPIKIKARDLKVKPRWMHQLPSSS